ncbi:choice-of-anchor I family protein [Flavicella marina]|uniref:choice-of-anchor I family protein n=1 Tax=Flavicella marina TaxID=1475951 RepID=UPI0012647D3C|nr:choice-of-anchor I family protein [Flavicella marina]
MKLTSKVFLVALSIGMFSCNDEAKENIKEIVDEIKDEVVDTTVDFNYKKTITLRTGPAGEDDSEGAAEIAAFDPVSKKLFVVNVEINEISIVNLSDVNNPQKSSSINLDAYGAPNSVAVYDGKIAVAVEADVKQNNGKILVFNAATEALEKQYTVGALPDMVTYTKDGKFILSANEGEPNDAYDNDPQGTISIIDVDTDVVTTLDFTAFNASEASLESDGFRVFGPNADLAKDVEPEYIAVSEDSKTAWVSLQENNGIAKVNIESKSIEAIYPLGFKDYNLAGNSIDASDKDGVKQLKNWNVKGIYQPDAITAINIGGTEYVISANEGDARDYDGYSEEVRLDDLQLDETVYPLEGDFLNEINLGRLKTTTTLGDANNDNKVEQIYSYGARSFSIWSANGSLVYDSGNDIAKETLIETPDVFNGGDKRSDDKGAEPESVTTLSLGNRHILFVGLERNNQVLIYDISNPIAPGFLDILSHDGDIGPEGLLVVPAADSPSGKDLLIVSNEVSGTVSIYENN